MLEVNGYDSTRRGITIDLSRWWRVFVNFSTPPDVMELSEVQPFVTNIFTFSVISISRVG